MNLLFVIDSLGSGGAQRQIVNLALGMHGKECEVEFLIYQPKYTYFMPVLAAAGIKAHQITKKGRYSTAVITALRKLFNSEQYSFCLSFLDTPNLYCELAVLGKRHPIPLIVSERSSYPERGASIRKRFLEQFHRLAQYVTVNSHYQANLMQQANPWLQRQIKVIYNGIDLDTFRPRSDTPIFDRTFLSVGSVIPVKNALGLAQALVEYARIFGSPPQIHWLGAIYQPPISDEHRKIQRLLAAHNLDSCWQWLGEQDDVHIRYPQYPALIHPSLREGLSNVVCEAMACGMPVLAGNIGEQSRLITAGVHGLLFDSRSPTEMACAMHAFLQMDDTQRRHMGMQARMFAEREFGIEVYVNRYKSLFQSLIAN